MKKIRELINEAAFIASALLLVLCMCALYWLCRLFGLEPGEDF